MPRRGFRGDEYRSGYKIPLPPGNYRLALHFCAHTGAAGLNVFDVYVGGELVFKDYDGFKMAGFGKADVRRFEVVVKDDGMLKLELRPTVGRADIGAIEIRALSER